MKINILSHTLTVVERKPPPADAYMGRSNTSAGRIEIARGMCLDAQRTTLLHEVLESIAQIMEIRDGRLDERAVAALEVGLFDFIVRNPAAVAIIAGRIPKRHRQKRHK